MAKKPDDVIAEVVRLLYDNRAMSWTVQKKGSLFTAIKLQLQEKQGRNA